MFSDCQIEIEAWLVVQSIPDSKGAQQKTA